jgi:hypothetical protein
VDNADILQNPPHFYSLSALAPRWAALFVGRRSFRRIFRVLGGSAFIMDQSP